MMGDDTDLWGALILTAGTSNSSTEINLATDLGEYNQALEGLRGVPVRWRDSNDAEHEATVLFATRDTLYLDRESDVAPDSAILTFGGQLFQWDSRAYDGDTPDLDKQLYFVDCSRDSGSSGSVIVELFRDLSTTSRGNKSLDLTLPFETLQVGEIIKEFRSVKLRFRNQTPNVITGTPEVIFEMFDVALRVRETDNQ
jgi:hypothetical protein